MSLFRILLSSVELVAPTQAIPYREVVFCLQWQLSEVYIAINFSSRFLKIGHKIIFWIMSCKNITIVLISLTCGKAFLIRRRELQLLEFMTSSDSDLTALQ
jgi:hypothetical protein